MRVLVFSDIHGDTRALERIVAQPADVYISAGDLSTFGRGLDRCGEILKPLSQRLWLCPEIMKRTSRCTRSAKNLALWIFISKCARFRRTPARRIGQA